VVTPLYGGVPRDGLTRLDSMLTVPMYAGPGFAAVRVGRLPGSDVKVYFLEHDHYYDRDGLYGYSDDLERYVFLSRGALELTKALGWIPDVVHANDWHTAFAPVYLNTIERGRPLHRTASVFTVHNLGHQGDQEAGAHVIAGLGWDHFNAGEFEHFGRFNPLKAALWHSTLLTTVSPRYATEIQTGAFGAGLDGILASRAADLYGILNGVDETDWDPSIDPHLPAHFDRDDQSGKAACKAELQRWMGLPVRGDVPLFGVVSRLTRQKGHDVLAAAIDRLLDLDLQLVVLGTGDRDIEQTLWSAAARRADRFACRTAFDQRLEHRIQAGADFLLVPSRFEPCGLTQMYAHRYGTLPIVRATGGLADTVVNYDERTGAGTGFVLDDLTPEAIVGTAAWARSTFVDRRHHLQAMRDRVMAQDWTWRRGAAEYERVYRLAYERRRGFPYPV
jgi:starch synthase